MSIVLQQSSERWKNCCWMYSWWMRAGFSPSPSLTLLSHEDQRGQRKSDNNCVLWSWHCFHLPSQFCCHSKSDLVWYGLLCFKGFWKKNKVVELRGLITARKLGSARALCVLWGCWTRTALYLWLFQLHAKFQNKPPTAYAGFFPLKCMQFIWFLVLPLSYMCSFKIKKKKILMAINSQRGLFSPWSL